MASDSLKMETFVLRGPSEDGGLDVAVARFRPDEAPAADSAAEHVSLLFVHGISYHKETWVPTVEHLFELQTAVPNNKFVIVEAWSVESPSHGQSAALNNDRLLAHKQGISPHEVARALQVFLKSGLYAGTSLIGVSHSAGVAVISLSTLGYDLGNLPYSSLILVEPPVMTRELFEVVSKTSKPWEMLSKAAMARKDIWPSRENAREWLSERIPWGMWDPRALDLFVQYGLRDLPTCHYPDKTEGVTLACTRQEEAALYVWYEDGFDSLDRLKEVCRTIPVHSIFGEREDIIPEFVKNALVQGNKMVSMATVANTGHLVVQENPKSLALAIWGVLHSERKLPGPTSKL